MQQISHPKAAKLSPRRERFVQEYLIDLNATQAAIRAGYAANSADVQGTRLLGNDSVRAVIAARQAAIAKKYEGQQGWIVEQLVENVNRSMQLKPVMRDGVAVGEYRYNGAVANKSLELLGRHRGMFEDKVNLGLDATLLALMRRIDSNAQESRPAIEGQNGHGVRLIAPDQEDERQ